MESLGINLGFLLIQCFSFLLLIGLMAVLVYLVFRLLKAVSTKQEDKLTNTEQEVLSVFNELKQDEKSKSLEQMKQQLDESNK